MMMLLFGPPGVGKGTQAELLSQKFHFIKFSMGDILRDEVARATPLGREAETYMKKGTLVPDTLIFRIVEAYVKEHQSESILFDGFPRTVQQAVTLEKTLQIHKKNIDLAIEMAIDDEIIVRRLVNRRYCPSCRAIYNLLSTPPRQPGICDHCSSPLAQRADDNEGTIRQRLNTYLAETQPLTEYYRTRNKYCRVDADGTQDHVFEEITHCLNAHRK